MSELSYVCVFPPLTAHTEPPVILSLAKLASLSEMEPEELFSTAVLYWVAKGVLKEVPDPTDGQSSSGSASKCELILCVSYQIAN